MACGLNGSNQFLTVPVDSALEFGTGDFTVALKMRINALGDNVPLMLGNGANGSAPIISTAWALRHFSGQLYWYRYEHPTETFYAFAWSPATGVTYDVLVTRTGTTLKAFVDSSQIGSSITSSVSYNRVNSDNFHVGRAIFGSTPFFFNGVVSEVGIWKAGLTDAEILSLSRGFTADQIRPQSLSFYAPLVRNFQDVRGGLAITNNNGATVATHPRIVT